MPHSVFERNFLLGDKVAVADGNFTQGRGSIVVGIFWLAFGFLEKRI